MKLVKESAEIFIPDNKPLDEALSRTTHMSIAAHQDDIEIMAYHGISECFGREDKWFLGVVVTNGAGSPRDDIYASYSDEDMQKIRKTEQKKAAFVGEYSAAVLMDYSSKEVKNPQNRDIIDELKELISAAQPDILYTHNLADKHDTHIGVVIKTIQAVRELSPELRPKKLYGCEVWRGLDWVSDSEKVLFDVSTRQNIAAAVLAVHDSQICGGKRYDLATAGRRMANATYSESHGVDISSSVIYGMDLTPLIEDTSIDIRAYIQGYIERFSRDVFDRISKVL